MSTPDTQANNKHSCLDRNSGSQYVLSCTCYQDVCVCVCGVIVLGSYEGDEEERCIPKKKCLQSLLTVAHDILKDPVLAVSDWDPEALAACSIIISIPYCDQTRARTRDTYLSLCFTVNLKQNVCIYLLSFPFCPMSLSDFFTLSLFLLLSPFFCVLPPGLSLAL